MRPGNNRILGCAHATLQKIFFGAAPFIIPFAIWVFLFHAIITAHSPIQGDEVGQYGYIKYFFDSLRTHTFALWNPFLILGQSQIFYNNFFCPFNPIWMIFFFLSCVGVKTYLAFVYTLTAYFFIGTIGFYLLAKTYFRDRTSAYLAFLLFLFSSFGMPTFHESKTLMIFVPLIWFYFFTLRFFFYPRLSSFTGILFCLMVIGTSYFPPYWLIFLFMVSFLAMVTAPCRMIEKVRKIKIFVARHVLFVSLGLIALGISISPSIKAFTTAEAKEIVFPHRAEDTQSIYEKSSHVGIDRMQRLMKDVSYFHKEYFASDLRMLSIKHAFPFFVSLFVFILLGLGAFNIIDRTILFFSLLAFLIFSITYMPTAPFYKFFFHYLPGFNLINGPTSFVSGMVAALIILAVHQWRKIIRNRFNLSKIANVVIVVLVHAAFLFFLIIHPHTTFSAYLTLVASFSYFLWAIYKKSNGWIAILLLLTCVTAHPLEILWHYGQNLQRQYEFASDIMQHPSVVPRFSYQRQAAQYPLKDYESYEFYAVSMQDAPWAWMRDFPARWTHFFLNQISKDVVDPYVQNKFYLYDHIAIIPDDQPYIVERMIAEKQNIAAVSEKTTQGKEKELAGLLLSTTSKISDHPLPILGPQKNFRVTAFTVNQLTIKTNFQDEKFLVYTDSYQSDWALRINGKKERLYRSQIAFKGVRLPAGENLVTLTYAPMGGEKTYWAILILFWGIFLLMVILHLAEIQSDRCRPFREKAVDH